MALTLLTGRFPQLIRLEQQLDRLPVPRDVALAGAVLLSLLCAHYWAFEFIPVRMLSLWGPYLVGPLGWLAAAGVALYAYRRLPHPAAEHDIEGRTILVVAGLVGGFMVALQVLTAIVADAGTSPFAHSPRWLATNALFAGAPLLAVEASRAAFLRSLGPRSLTIALVGSSIGLAAVQFPPRHYQLDGFVANAEFWGSVFIPMVATGLLAGFFVLYGGLRAGLLCTAPLVVFTYYSPFLPIAPWPIIALVGVAGPATGLWVAESLFADAVAEQPEEKRGFVALPSIAWVLTAVMALVIFWFSFGFFGYRPSFVPSHSMEPHINQGDVVLAGPVQAGDVKVGDIILYELPNGRQVLHRVIEITKSEDGARLFITRGDNNNTGDLRPVTDEQLVGRYVGRVPYLGWVPIKFNQWLVDPFR